MKSCTRIVYEINKTKRELGQYDDFILSCIMLKNGLTYFQNLAVTIFQHDAQKGFQLTFTCLKSTVETLGKSEICSMLTIITPE